ncbi:glycosyltransferase family 4 protein [Salinimicrobium catena]|uniref:glycosyltransferase family 4 protein n=1 Tax=Salinimicrobium catena TaxID=390640 RepID=UPI002FE4E590
MNILHISAVKNWGGGENHIENLCLELQRSNPEVTNLILCTRGKKFHQRLTVSELDHETAPLKVNFDPRFIYKIGSLCKSRKIDLIHLHDPRAMALAVFADKFFDLSPFVFSKKISFPVKKRKQTLYKYNYPKIKKYLCVSNHTKDIMAEAVKDKEKLKTIYHGTRIDNKSDKTSFLLREQFDLAPQDTIIGNIANHHRAKSLETFIQVADHLINKKGLKDFHFIQIGTFTERTAALQEKVKELNLEQNVHFLGYTPRASNFLPQFDITLITSSNEGMPQVIYESFYHKVPVVSTSVAGIPEIVKNGETGFLADKFDFLKLSDLILHVKNNPEEMKAITERSRKALLENYTTTKMAQKTLAEYKKIVYGL